ncbi:ATP-grasp domain-containing protein [Hahella aquimaris]|uniref:ATP-grasp domain-containing protein n=1 Tax=Hahella sp. HNIBRBA332 TaxID=3015983 RepID=UPI00273C6BC0|nr:ATP-grasp domain-containing protein [Hahella sp. HNIBRBA332]WLQ15153.1 ATP-grasp domain-containing protein [Hahella sp. HNIBRBA332]
MSNKPSESTSNTSANLLWVVQSNLGDSDDAAKIESSCRGLGYDCAMIRVIPFATDLPDIPNDRPTIFYGSSNFITHAHRSGKWSPCAYFDERQFLFSEALRHYGNRLLNADARILTMEQFAQSGANDEEVFFIRPNGDLKEFAGTITTFKAFRDWADKLRPGGFTVDLSLPMVAAKPKDIEHEWRLFIVAGMVVAASHYRADGRMQVFAGAPETVISFTEEMAATWSPAPVFVMDVAVCAGELYVLEINGFNSSGFYACDIEAIVREVSAYALSGY